MIRKRLAAVTIAAALVFGSAFAADSWVVRKDGIGPIKIGMSLHQLNSTLHTNFAEPKDKEEQGCFYVNLRKHPHISLMIENDHLVRIDVDKAGIPTDEGIQVRDSEEHALQVYGANLKVEEHKYNPEGHYLTVRSKDGHHGIRFETNKGKIEQFYAGSFEAIQYVEGCL